MEPNDQIFVKGPRVYLREMRPADCDAIQEILSDFRNTEITRSECIRFMQGCMHNHDAVTRPYTAATNHIESLVVCLSSTDQVIGVRRFKVLGFNVRVTMAAIMPSMRSQGYGTEVSTLFVRTMFEDLGVQHIIADIRATHSTISTTNGPYRDLGENGEIDSYGELLHDIDCDPARFASWKADMSKSSINDITKEYHGDLYKTPRQRKKEL